MSKIKRVLFLSKFLLFIQKTIFKKNSFAKIEKNQGTKQLWDYTFFVAITDFLL